jgi:hypothetical protein
MIHLHLFRLHLRLRLRLHLRLHRHFLLLDLLPTTLMVLVEALEPIKTRIDEQLRVNRTGGALT